MIPLKDDVPTRRFPVVTVAIIVICCAVYFIFEQGLWDLGTKGNERVIDYGAIPYEISHPGKECGQVTGGQPGQVACEGQPGVTGTAPDQPPWWVTIFTAMFMHGSLLHLAGNMLFLWIFGNNIEDSMSRWRFALFYVLGGLVALGAQTVVDPSATVPTVGASGAIAAVLGAYALLYPRARVITVIFIIIFFTVVELPAMVVLGFWILLQLFLGASDLTTPGGGQGGVAYFAHIVGFAFGLLAIRAFANRVQDDYTRSHRLPVY
jgi:membrane associated rhomboid family serine protease